MVGLGGIEAGGSGSGGEGVTVDVDSGGEGVTVDVDGGENNGQRGRDVI